MKNLKFSSGYGNAFIFFHSRVKRTKIKAYRILKELFTLESELDDFKGKG